MEKYEVYKKLKISGEIHEIEANARKIGVENNKDIEDFKRIRISPLLMTAKEKIEKFDKNNLSEPEKKYINLYEECIEAYSSNNAEGLTDYFVKMKFFYRMQTIIGVVNSSTLKESTDNLLDKKDIEEARKLLKARMKDKFTTEDKKKEATDLYNMIDEIIEAYSHVANYTGRERVHEEIKRYRELSDKKTYYEHILGRMEELVTNVLGPNFNPAEQYEDRAENLIKRDKNKNRDLRSLGVKSPRYQSFRWGMDIIEDPKIVLSTKSVFDENIDVVHYGYFGYNMLYHEPNIRREGNETIADYGKPTFSSESDANIYGVTKVDKFGKSHTDFILSRVSPRNMQIIEEQTSTRDKAKGGFISNVYLSDYMINEAVLHNGSFMGSIELIESNRSINVTFKEVTLADAITAARYAKEVPGVIARRGKDNKKLYQDTLYKEYDYLRREQDKILMQEELDRQEK